MKSEATTVDEYLDELPDDRRPAIEAVREVVRDNLRGGFVEVMNWGMITYEVPLATYPDTYNGKPLMYAGLASQKNYMVLYLSSPYQSLEGEAAFKKAYLATGKRLDMGKSCVRFRKLDDLPLDLVAETIGSFSADQFVDHVATSRAARA